MSGPERSGAQIFDGGCECGAVSYGVEGPFAYAGMCHCSHCRAATGSAFKPYAGIERAKLTLSPGAGPVMTVGEPDDCAVRCAGCGSLLYSVVRGGEFVHVAMGTLRGDPAISPAHHIFVGSKAPWHEITDSLPQYEELPD